MRKATALTFAVLLAVTSGCYREHNYSPTDPGVLLLIVEGSDSVPADNISRVHLLARVTPEAASSKRTIDFSTSAGTLIGGTGTSATEKTVDVDVKGEARIDLQAPSSAQAATVTARVKDQPILRQITINFTAVNANAVVNFVIAPKSAPADGATESLFTVMVPAFQTLDPNSRSVTFQTTAGKLLPDATSSVSVPVNSTGQASVTLRSAETLTTAIVRATIANTTAETRIEFVPALPEVIELLPDKTTVQGKSSDSTIVRITLRRTIGKVTPGTFITFHATTSTGAVIGIFHDQVTASDANGQASTTFSPGDTAYRGPITITVEVAGTNVRGTTTIQVVEPSGS